MRIYKLIFTKNGHHYRQVKSLRKDGIFQVITDDWVYSFCDKKEVRDIDELFQYIEKKRKQWERDKKLENLLD